jgi:hypothetical protein
MAGACPESPHGRAEAAAGALSGFVLRPPPPPPRAGPPLPRPAAKRRDPDEGPKCKNVDKYLHADP